MPPKSSDMMEKIHNALVKSDDLRSKLGEFISAGSERALLSILLTSPKSFHQIRSAIHLEHFGNIANQKLYEIIVGISDKNNGNWVAPEMLFYVNEAENFLREVGGADYIKAIITKPYPDTNINKVIELLQCKKIQRERWIQLCSDMQMLMDYNGSSVDDVIAIGMESHFELIHKNQEAFSGVQKFGNGLRARLEELAKNPVKSVGIPISCFPLLSEDLDGLRRRSLSVTAARAKRGKSTFQMCIALDAAVRQKVSIGMIESEMEPIQQEHRALSNLSSVYLKKIETGSFAQSPEDLKAVAEGLSMIENNKIYMRRIPIFDTTNIINSIKLMHALHQTEVIFFDQIKDTTDAVRPNAEKEHQRIGWLALALKHIAEELNIHVHANMQFGRSGVEENLASGIVDPSTCMADSDRVIRFANTSSYLRRKTDAEIARDGGIIRGGDTIYNIFANRDGRSHEWKGGICYLHRGCFTRFEEVMRISS